MTESNNGSQICERVTKYGAEIAGLSQVPTEAEVLLPAGMQLKLTGVLPKDASGLIIIQVEDDVDAPPMVL